MKKIKLLITSAALLVGGGLLASSSNNIMKANAADIDLTNCQYEKIDSVEALSDGNYIFGYDVNFDENTSSIKSGNFLGSFGENIFQRTTELNGAETINIKRIALMAIILCKLVNNMSNTMEVAIRYIWKMMEIFIGHLF